MSLLQGFDKRIRTILVDDEADACENLSYLLDNHTQNSFEVLGLAHNFTDASKLITLHKPEIVFLDIEMPGENAFSFLSRIESYNFEVIFVTAYDNYAITALKLNAIDYLLKPVSIEELQVAVQKLKNKLTVKEKYSLDNFLLSQTAQIFTNKEKPKNIVLKDQNGIKVIELKYLMYIEAKGAYSKFYYNKSNSIQTITVSHPISEYEELLGHLDFYRIHKSFIINVAEIDKLVPDEFTLLLVSGDKLPIGRRRYSEFVSYLKCRSVS